MFCPKCGNEIYNGVGFCDKCGEKIDVSESMTDQQFQFDEKPKTDKSKETIKKVVTIGVIGVIALIIVVVALIAKASNGKDSQESNNKGYSEKNVEDAYTSILDEYINAFKEGKWDSSIESKYPNVSSSIMSRFSSYETKNIYYAIFDVDSDGINELIIAEGDAEGGTHIILEMYRFNDGKVTKDSGTLPNESSGMSFKLLAEAGAKPTVAEPANKQELKVVSSGSTANCTLREWESGEWKETLSFSAYIGANGVTTNKKEGDKCTPAGTFNILFAFSTNDISTNLEVENIYEGMEWVTDTNSTSYNVLRYYRDTHYLDGGESNPEYWKEYEDMYKQFTSGKSFACIAFDFNGDCKHPGTSKKGGGSAIWIDGMGPNANATSGYGDIKISKDDMIKLLRHLDKACSPIIIIS